MMMYTPSFNSPCNVAPPANFFAIMGSFARKLTTYIIITMQMEVRIYGK